MQIPAIGQCVIGDNDDKILRGDGAYNREIHWIDVKPSAVKRNEFCGAMIADGDVRNTPGRSEHYLGGKWRILLANLHQEDQRNCRACDYQPGQGVPHRAPGFLNGMDASRKEQADAPDRKAMRNATPSAQAAQKEMLDHQKINGSKPVVFGILSAYGILQADSGSDHQST